MKNLQLDAITFDDVEAFLEEKMLHSGCTLCGETSLPAVISTEGKIVFTDMLGTDSTGDEKLGTVPLIPLVCQSCGKITHITPTPLLNFVQEKYNEQQ